MDVGPAYFRHLNLSTLALRLAFLGVLSLSCDSEPEEADDPVLPAVTANPDGIPYPTDHIGGQKRGGTHPGDRMPNFTFHGYRDGDRSKGLTTISMADYYDPSMARNKVLYVQFAGTWCAVCSGELEASVTITDKAKAKGIVLLEVVVSGATAGKGPSLDEFNGWADRHHTNFTTAIDVRAKRTSLIGINGEAMPHDVLIDTRTMEILDSSVGAPSDVGVYALEGLDFVEKNPPSVWE